MEKTLIIGSRGSDLALWQARYVQTQLLAQGVASEIQIIKTQGDQIQHLSFDKMEGKGFFTKELEEALLNKTIDLAVHSHKDMETSEVAGLHVAAVSDRESPADILLISRYATDITQVFNLKKYARVGTSSARRKAQLLGFRPDITLADIRGNVPTRIEKLRKGDFDAIMLAHAGVKRLNIDLSEFLVVELAATHFIPAPAQGVLALQCRADDDITSNALAALNHRQTAQIVKLERAVMQAKGGGCQSPIGVYTYWRGHAYALHASMANDWTDFPKRAYVETHENASLQEIIDQVMSQIQHPQNHQLFISREIDADGYFSRYFKARGAQITAKSLIDFEAIAVGQLPEVDWIFFSSKRSISFFLRQVDIKWLKSKKLGCIGNSTAMALRKKGIEPDFVGNVDDVFAVGRQFFSLVQKGKVLFPQSDRSVRTIQQVLGKSDAFEVNDLLVYKTILLNDTPIAAHQVYVFTSPSNVQAFFEAGNKIPAQAKVIGIGERTHNSLIKLGQLNAIKSIGYEEIDLVDTVIGTRLK